MVRLKFWSHGDCKIPLIAFAPLSILTLSGSICEGQINLLENYLYLIGIFEIMYICAKKKSYQKFSVSTLIL